MSLFNELKRRNVFRVGLAYLVGAWVIAQVADLVLDNIDAPPWVMQALLLFLGLGFIIAIIVSWAYELTPDGLKKDSEVTRDESIANHTAKKLDYITLAGVLLVVGLFAYQQMNPATQVVNSNPNSVIPAPTGIQVEESAEVGNANQKPLKVNKTEASFEKSIAVLPFVNMSSDKEQEYFSDGLTESLLHQLAQVKELRVAARTSSFKFKGHNDDMTSIGQQLRVAHLLEGSVQRAGSTLRITAQLIKVDDGFHLWSQVYDRSSKDLFAIQDEISQEVVTALKVSLLDEIDHTSIGGTENTFAYEEYAKGLLEMNLGSFTNLSKAEAHFKAALEQDPNYQLALEGLGQNYASMAITGMINLAGLGEKLDPITEKLSSMNKKSGVMYTLQGISEWSKNLKLDKSLDSVQTSLEKGYNLAQSNIFTGSWISRFYNTIGQVNMALEILKKQAVLDPLSAETHHDLANLNITINNIEKALFHAQQVLRLNPNDPNSNNPLTSIYQKTLQMSKANKLIADSETLDPDDHELPATMAMNSLAVFMPDQAKKQIARAEKIDATGQSTVAANASLLYQQGKLEQAAQLVLQNVNNNPGTRLNFSELVFLSVLSQYAYETQQPKLITEKLLPWLDVNFKTPVIRSNGAYIMYMMSLDILKTSLSDEAIQGIIKKAELYRSTTDNIDRSGLVLNNAKRDKKAVLSSLEKEQETGVGRLWWLELKSHRYDWVRQEPRFKAVKAKIMKTVEEQQKLISGLEDTK